MDSFDKFKEKIIEYGKSNGSIPTIFDKQTCTCGNDLFLMYSDDTEGGCGIVCSTCEAGISIENSADYMEDVVQNTCTCEAEALYVMVGKSLYEGSDANKWVYVGGMCPKCGLAGVYVDWLER